MQFPHIDLGDYTGPRDLSPAHIRAILERPGQMQDQHITDWLDHMAHLEFLREEQEARERAEERREEEARNWDRELDWQMSERLIYQRSAR